MALVYFFGIVTVVAMGIPSSNINISTIKAITPNIPISVPIAFSFYRSFQS